MNYQFTNKALAASLYDAFQAEPFYLAIANARADQNESVKAALLKYFDFSIQEGLKYGATYTLDNQSVGASIWHKPSSKAVSQQQGKEKKNFLIKHFGEASLGVYKKIVRSMMEKEQEIIEAHYWYLSILAVAKTHQGKGFGRQLLSPVLAEIDQLGLPSFLETFTEGNLVFYGKMGYKVVVEYLEPNLNKRCWILVRPPIL